MSMASFDGLASGLDTTSLINSLMQLERLPQQRLQTQRSALVRENSYYTEINRQMGAVSTAAKALTGVNGWDSAKATSSDSSRVAVTAASTAPAGSLTFTVDQLAQAASSVSANDVAGKDAVIVDPATTPKIYLTKGVVGSGTEIETEIDVGDGKLSTIVANINAAGVGVTATAVNVGDANADGTNEYRLQLQSTTTGASSTISVTDAAGGGTDPFVGVLGGMNPLVTGANSILRVGGNGDGTGGYEVERASNTFSDLLDDVTFTLAKADPATSVTVGVERDPDAIAGRVSKLVDAANAALSGMAKHQAYDTDSNTAGPLMGDSFVRRLRSALVRAATDSVGGNAIGTPGLAGVEIQRDGTVKFDRDKFIEEYEKDPAAVQALLGKDGGVAGRLEALAANTKTQVDDSVKARSDRLPQIDTQLASWNNRLEIREQTLRRQFQQMEVALGEMQAQGSWLSSQIGQLNANSGGT